MTKLNKILASMLLAAAALPVAASAQIQPQTLSQQQAQTQAQLNQQNAQTQANSQQLQQNMAKDQRSNQLLFHPQTVAPLHLTPPPAPPKPK